MNSVSPERLNRFLARRGVASRRGADALIVSGRVDVNGRAAAVGSAVDPECDVVHLDGQLVAPAAVTTTLMLNKPPGVVTTTRDPQRRPTVMGLVNAVAGLVPVGRLDLDSRGLLLLSTDGELVHRLSHPRHGIVKRYRVTVDRPPAPSDIRRLTAGVELDDGPARALSARRAGSASPNVVDVSLAEGRKRELRRLFAALGYEVCDLVRVAIGPIRLGNLAEGAARPLAPGELAAVYSAVGLPPR